MTDLDTYAIALDLETTSADETSARIVQFSLASLDDDLIEIETWTRLVNPPKPITPEAAKVHGIRHEDVEHEARFDTFAPGVQDRLDAAEYAIAYNGAFDLTILDRELQDAGQPGVPNELELVDPYRVFREHLTHSLEDAYNYYTGKRLTGAHDAEADTRATIDVLRRQLRGQVKHSWPETLDDALETGEDGARPLDWAGRLLKDAEGTVRFAFGKHEGEPVLEHWDYAAWMLRNDFPENTKTAIRDTLDQGGAG